MAVNSRQQLPGNGNAELRTNGACWSREYNGEEEMSELIVIEIAPEVAPTLYTQNGLDGFLEQIRKSVNEVPDLSTAKGRARIASLSAQVSRSKTAIEKPGRDYLKRLKELPKEVEAELRRFVTECDASDISLMFEKDAGTSIEADGKALALFNDLRDMKSRFKSLEKEIEVSEEKLKLYMQEHSILTLDGKPLCTWKTQVSNRFDQKAFQLENPGLYEKFKKTTSSRVLRMN